MRGITFLATGDAAPAVTYCAGWFISTASWAKGTQPGDTGRRLWHAGSNGRWNCGVVIAPEIDFAVLVACNRGCTHRCLENPPDGQGIDSDICAQTDLMILARLRS